MLKRLFSNGRQFFDLLSNEAQVICNSSQALINLLDNIGSIDQMADSIKTMEGESDDITEKIIHMLDTTFITPIDREDIHELASVLDDVIDLVEAVSSRIQLFKITRATPASKEMARLIARATQEVFQGVSLLGAEKSNKQVYERCHAIKKLEEEADKVNRRAIAALFEEETNPIQVIKWYEIYGFLEDAMDSCEDVADILESIALKHN